MRIYVLTLFPRMFESPLSESIVGRAIEAGKLDIRIRNVRDHARDKHHVTDDAPYGGGAGMVMKVEPLVEAVETIQNELTPDKAHVIYLSPQGRVFNQELAGELARRPHLILICGRYEGVDQRVLDLVVDEELSIGDYVLTGGELPAMVAIDAVARLIPGVVGCADSVEEESFRNGLLDWPHYTRPEEFRGLRVPETLLSGHHAKIREWRLNQAIEKTKRVRPDLYEKWKMLNQPEIREGKVQN